MATRPLHFIWICDSSGSMSTDGKIQTLNMAIKESIPHMRHIGDENPNANVLVRSLKFSNGIEWHIPHPTPLKDLEWTDLIADPLQNPTLNTDIVFMIDTSGSMGDEIETVKSNCDLFADKIIKEGANVRLGLLGFDIGGYRGEYGIPQAIKGVASRLSNRGAELMQRSYNINNLSRYTIGSWTLTSPEEFKKNIQTLSLGLFGGEGCYLTNQDTVDIFPHVVSVFNGPPENARILVIISDEMGNTEGLHEIVSQLKKASITAHVLGVPGDGGAHESIAAMTGGKFWDIVESKGAHDFGDILGTVAETIGKEITKKLADGTVSAGTDMGLALRTIADQLKIPPMNERALPPVLVLISDGQPTDDFDAGLKAFMDQPWGKKAVRIAIAVGKDADNGVLQRFIGNPEIKCLKANNPEALIKYIKWASTVVLKSASAPQSQTKGSVSPIVNVPITMPVEDNKGPSSAGDIW